MARCVFDGSFPACQAITASTANSGSVCSHARMANARPCDIRNCAASAAQAMTNEEKRMLGNVQSADSGEFPFGIIGGRLYRFAVDRWPLAVERASAFPPSANGQRRTANEMQTISSRHNELFKRVRDAARAHGEEIVVEGPKAVADAIAAGWRALLVVGQDLVFSDALMNDLTGPKTPPG